MKNEVISAFENDELTLMQRLNKVIYLLENKPTGHAVKFVPALSDDTAAILYRNGRLEVHTLQAGITSAAGLLCMVAPTTQYDELSGAYVLTAGANFQLGIDDETLKGLIIPLSDMSITWNE